jgi:type IX secretion system PorP/SprF family membrane protein
MKKIYTLVLLTCTAYLYGQQDVQYTQFWNNRLYYNPAVAGSENAICLNSGGRTQWIGFDNAPRSQNFTASIPISILRGGLGIRVENDQIGFFQDIAVALSYAYQHRFADGSSLGFGVSADFRDKGLNTGNWIPPDAGQPDIALLNFNNSNLTTDVNFGVYYNSEKLWVGLSSSRLLRATTELTSFEQGVTGVRSERHFFLMGGYNIFLENSPFIITPQLMVKSDLLSPFAVDINTLVTYNNQIWGGVTYRHQDALAISAGYNISPDFRLGLSYDITLSSIAAYSGGSYEFFARYCFTIEIPPREKGYYRNVRFL